jgi:ABC-type Zn2+ transport system substrate-binding protein/surface adhesin
VGGLVPSDTAEKIGREMGLWEEVETEENEDDHDHDHNHDHQDKDEEEHEDGNARRAGLMFFLSFLHADTPSFCFNLCSCS